MPFVREKGLFGAPCPSEQYARLDESGALSPPYAYTPALRGYVFDANVRGADR